MRFEISSPHLASTFQYRGDFKKDELLCHTWRLSLLCPLGKKTIAKNNKVQIVLTIYSCLYGLPPGAHRWTQVQMSVVTLGKGGAFSFLFFFFFWHQVTSINSHRRSTHLVCPGPASYPFLYEAFINHPKVQCRTCQAASLYNTSSFCIENCLGWLLLTGRGFQLWVTWHSSAQTAYFLAVLTWTELEKQNLQQKVMIYHRDPAGLLLKILLPGLLSPCFLPLNPLLNHIYPGTQLNAFPASMGIL